MAESRGLWATVCEIEPGLFQAIYSNAQAGDVSKLPEYRACDSRSEAKGAFEKSAYLAGLGPIMWVEVNVADLDIPKPGHFPKVQTGF
jgi:hypothetical protein